MVGAMKALTFFHSPARRRRYRLGLISIGPGMSQGATRARKRSSSVGGGGASRMPGCRRSTTSSKEKDEQAAGSHPAWTSSTTALARAAPSSSLHSSPRLPSALPMRRVRALSASVVSAMCATHDENSLSRGTAAKEEGHCRGERGQRTMAHDDTSGRCLFLHSSDDSRFLRFSGGGAEVLGELGA